MRLIYLIPKGITTPLNLLVWKKTFLDNKRFEKWRHLGTVKPRKYGHDMDKSLVTTTVKLGCHKQELLLRGGDPDYPFFKGTETPD